MGYSVHVWPAHGLATVTLVGRLDGVELLRAMRALAFDPGWVPGGHVVWDARYLRAIALGRHDMPAFEAVTRELAHRMGPGRSAVLCRDARERAAAHLLDLRRRGHPGRELQAFLSWPDAAPWLGVPESAFDARAPWHAWPPPHRPLHWHGTGRA